MSNMLSPPKASSKAGLAMMSPGLPRPHSHQGVKSKSNTRNTPVVTRNSRKPSQGSPSESVQSFQATTTPWPTPAEAAAISIRPPANQASSNTPIRSPNRGSYPSAGLSKQAPVSVVSEDRKRRQSLYEQSRLEDAQIFMDKVIWGTESPVVVQEEQTASADKLSEPCDHQHHEHQRFSELSAEKFMDVVCGNGVPLCRLVNRIMGTMRITVRLACPLGVTAQQTQNSVFFQEACRELLKGTNNSHSVLNITDVQQRRLKPIVDNILAIRDVFDARNKELDAPEDEVEDLVSMKDVVAAMASSAEEVALQRSAGGFRLEADMEGAASSSEAEAADAVVVVEESGGDDDDDDDDGTGTDEFAESPTTGISDGSAPGVDLDEACGVASSFATELAAEADSTASSVETNVVDDNSNNILQGKEEEEDTQTATTAEELLRQLENEDDDEDDENVDENGGNVQEQEQDAAKENEDASKLLETSAAAPPAAVDADSEAPAAVAEDEEKKGGAEVEPLPPRVAVDKAEFERLKAQQAAVRECGLKTLESLSSLKTQGLDKLKAGAQDAIRSCAVDVVVLLRELGKATQKHCAAVRDTEQALKKETLKRKKYFNELQVLKGNIRVLVRVRPPATAPGASAADTGADTAAAASLAVRTTSTGDLLVTEEGSHQGGVDDKVLPGTKAPSPPRVYEFDHVFGSASTQDQVFAEVSPLVTSVMDGYHASIMAYGQTGSGKTFTMEGTPEAPGVNLKALSELFRLKSEKEASGLESVRVKLTMVEVYNEQVRDLLLDTAAAATELESSSNSSSSSGFCEIKMRPANEGGGVFLPTATVLEVSGEPDVALAMARGKSNRSTGSTKANATSSRSHSVLMVNVKVVNSATGLETQGRLSLVDLAGSERISKTGASGQTLKEAQAINKSLSALGNVISALKNRQDNGGGDKPGNGGGDKKEGAKEKGGGSSKQAGHIPFRDSKLTYLLQDSLGADNKTLMIVQVGPEQGHVQETVCSLAFGQRARNVELGSSSSSSSKGKSSKTGGAASADGASGGGGGTGGNSKASQLTQATAQLAKATKEGKQNALRLEELQQKLDSGVREQEKLKEFDGVRRRALLASEQASADCKRKLEDALRQLAIQNKNQQKLQQQMSQQQMSQQQQQQQSRQPTKAQAAGAISSAALEAAVAEAVAAAKAEAVEEASAMRAELKALRKQVKQGGAVAKAGSTPGPKTTRGKQQQEGGQEEEEEAEEAEESMLSPQRPPLSFAAVAASPPSPEAVGVKLGEAPPSSSPALPKAETLTPLSDETSPIQVAWEGHNENAQPLLPPPAGGGGVEGERVARKVSFKSPENSPHSNRKATAACPLSPRNLNVVDEEDNEEKEAGSGKSRAPSGSSGNEDENTLAGSSSSSSSSSKQKGGEKVKVLSPKKGGNTGGGAGVKKTTRRNSCAPAMLTRNNSMSSSGSSSSSSSHRAPTPHKTQRALGPLATSSGAAASASMAARAKSSDSVLAPSANAATNTNAATNSSSNNNNVGISRPERIAAETNSAKRSALQKGPLRVTNGAGSRESMGQSTGGSSRRQSVSGGGFGSSTTSRWH